MSTLRDLFVRLRRDARLGHAFVFTGGTVEEARAEIQRLCGDLLCESGDRRDRACGECRGCQQQRTAQHPNLQWLGPEPGKRDIPIEALREAMARLALTGHYGSAKLLVLDPADALNAAGRNALLKTLEEPPADTHLMLRVERLLSLPATVRSRCQIHRLPARDPVTEIPDPIRQLQAGQLQKPLAQTRGLDREQALNLLRGLYRAMHLALRESQLGSSRETFTWLNDLELGVSAERIAGAMRPVATGVANPQLAVESLMIELWKRRAGRKAA